MNTVFDIQRFSIHDGPGIRTTVFLKGCPLHCIWCHNPESLSADPDLFYHEKNCIGCGACAAVCPQGCHIVTDAGHLFERENCVHCGKCAEACPAGALEVSGQQMPADAVLREVLKDRPFYKETGGMTLSGGEPLYQADFAAALLKAAKAEGLHTAVETSGFGPEAALRKLMPYTDLFLFDIKETDEARHRTYTGAGCEEILRNLCLLDRENKEIILRCPVIPGCNDREDHFRAIAALANTLHHVKEIHIEPYHDLGVIKAKDLGREVAASFRIPDAVAIEGWIRTVSEGTGIPVKRS